MLSILTGWFGRSFGLAIYKMIPYIVGVVLVVGLYLYVRHDAYSDGVEDTTEKYERAISLERQRLEAANLVAANEARLKIMQLERQ